MTQPLLTEEERRIVTEEKPRAAPTTKKTAETWSTEFHRPKAAWSGHALAAASVGIATVLRILLEPVFGSDRPFATYILAVVFTSWWAGFKPGLTAMVLGALVGVPLFVGFDGPTGLQTSHGGVGLLLYATTTSAVATICGSLRRAKSEAERSAALAIARGRALEAEIDARLEAQDKAREADDRTRRLLDNIAEAVLALDLDWRILYANTNASALFRLPADATGQRLWDQVRSVDLQQGLEPVMRTGLPRRFEIQEPREGRWIELRAYPTPEGITLFGRDVTDEKRARTALEESEERYRAFVGQSTEAIWRFELERPVKASLPPEEQIDHFYKHAYLAECNDTMARQYGFQSAEEIVGARLQELLPREDPLNVEYLRAFIKAGYRLDAAESVERDREGKPRVFLNNLLGIQRDGMLLRAWGTQRDVTEQKRHEHEIRTMNAALERRVQERTTELEVANRELEAFCYSVSHDLRAPLRSIMAQSVVLQEDYADRLDPEGVDTLARLARAAKNMAQLIDDLLELSRLHRATLSKENVDVTALAEAVVQELRSRGACEGVEVRVRDGLRAYADAGLLRVALVNLLENACKFSCKSDAPRVELEQAEEGAFCVRDNGIGFDMQYADKLFQPFERLHRVDEYPGTGIGLANVARVIERHGGRIWAEGEPGRGAAFYFTLPGPSAG